MNPRVLVAVEGDTDAPVASQLVAHVGLHVDRVIVTYGHGRLDTRVRRWCAPSNRRPMFVLRDQDPMLGTGCVPALVQKMQGAGPTSPTTVVRIAERELEAWLLADQLSFSQFFSVARSSLPKRPDDEPDPKQTFVNLCRRSTSSRIRSGMVPTVRSGRTVGPEFTGLVLEFSSTVWNVTRAMDRSPSLARAVRALEALADESPPTARR